MRKPRLIVVGIDSGCWEYLDPLIRRGEITNIARLRDNGTAGILRSVIPPVSSVAWASFMTGKNPGKHSLFDWLVYTGKDHDFRLFSGADRCGTPFTFYMNRAGLRVGLIDIPTTYPPQPLDGFVICGLDAQESSRRLTYPDSLLQTINQRYGQYEVEVPFSILYEQGETAYCKAWAEEEDRRTQIAIDAASDFDIDVLVLNYVILDRVNHVARDYQLCEAAIRCVDENIGRLLCAFPNTDFVILSDHGSRRTPKTFELKRWLYDRDYLVTKEKDRTSFEGINWALAELFQEWWGMNGFGERVLRKCTALLLFWSPAVVRRIFESVLYRVAPGAASHYRRGCEIDWTRTRLFAPCPTGMVWINSQDRFSTGGVSGPSQIRNLIHKFASEVQNETDPDTGQRIFEGVVQTNTAYTEPYVKDAPELYLDLSDSPYTLLQDARHIRPTSRHDTKYVVDSQTRFGDHSMNGLFVVCGPSFRKVIEDEFRVADLMDIPATLLYATGVPIPEDYDGHPLLDLFEEPFVEQWPVRYQQSADPVSHPGEAVSSVRLETEIAPEVVERLHALGYLE